MEEIREAHINGQLEEVFGTVTAAVISPIGELSWKDEVFYMNTGETGKLSKNLYDALTDIQKGAVENQFGWVLS